MFKIWLFIIIHCYFIFIIIIIIIFLIIITIVISAEGVFYKAKFDPEKGGECEQIAIEKFVKGTED